MGQGTAYEVLTRLRRVDWGNDTAAFGHANSCALLMREYLRRTALWARASGAADAWPFLGIADRVAADVTVPADAAAELEAVLAGLAPHSLKVTCRAAVRWAVLREQGVGLPADLPDEPYEPLLLMYERGGGYYLEEFHDLNGAVIRLGKVESTLSPPRPFPRWTA
ncbi:hypothetical protein [Streptomyces clavuligerus]|uniref:hypothetical protein n=1 Tax=Streptomyces clavuligerus TaxID=1901 RepID=UPI0001852095|nr:hypothetical protein [Streptomyces clavuligerus]WDN55922.1 hypothetical protein LL058_28920 [Streptomyces clavuligerus]